MQSNQIIHNLVRQQSEKEQIEQRQTKLVARLLAKCLLDDQPPFGCIMEATVHRSKRSNIFVACFTGPNGGQVWKSTGLADHEQALLLAHRWAAEAKAQRLKAGLTNRKSVLRVRHGNSKPDQGLLTQQEVAKILNLSVRAVGSIERRAIEKLRNHPLLKGLWREYLAGQLDEATLKLTATEVVALFDLAESPEESRLIEKVIRLIQN